MSTTRRRFLIRICQVAAVPAIPAFVGCGSDEVSIPDLDASSSVCSSIGSSIGGNHGHTVAVTVVEVELGDATSVALTSNGSHGHSLSLGVADLATLSSGGTVTIESTTNAGHSHSVVLSCVLRDAGVDSGTTDSGSTDSGTTDSGSTDSGPTDSGSTDSGPTDASTTCASSSATFSSNHNHTLAVPMSDVVAGVDKTYTSMGTATHTHDITVTAADFATLAAGGTVTPTTSGPSSGGAHTHVVTIVCLT